MEDAETPAGGLSEAGIADALRYVLYARAVRLVEERYASAGDVDLVARLGLGLPQGPLRTLNEIGLDEAYRVLDTMPGVPATRCTHRRRCCGSCRRPGWLAGAPASASATGPRATPSRTRRRRRRWTWVRPGRYGRSVWWAPARWAPGSVAFLRAGSRVVQAARSPAGAGSATDAVRREIARNGGTAADQAVLRGWTVTTDLTALRGCELVVEAVAEDAAVKLREPALAPAPLLERLVAAGHLGTKSGHSIRPALRAAAP
jgi:3-hydroxybutyryl-CoA dehydrogenase